MCLALPGKLTEIYHKNELRMARIDFGGIAKEICLEFLPEAEPGDYALIH
ncbi:MAG: HypC/HybG/HupF family hydrogenase formation chaperone, partial [Candidatus Electrothrix sp. LOE2]|nr:HypC/HybG/HupF family hydrogenase formation chaperone [Candidatus Electrothrix sp. LOE2]